MYPLTVIFASFAFVMISPPAFKSVQHKWRSDAANLLVSFFAMHLVFSFLSCFVDQHLKYNAIELLAKQCKYFVTNLTKSFDIAEFSYLNLLILYMFKSIFLVMLYEYCIVAKMFKISKKIRTWAVVFMSANFTILIVPNVFYASMIIVYFMFKQINLKIKRIVRSAASVNSESGTNETKFYRMQSYCELSDRLDEMALLHLEICKLTRDINAVFSLHLTNYITLKYTTKLVHLFFVYMYVSSWAKQDDVHQFPTTLIVNAIQTILINALELAIKTHVCYITAREVI